MSASQERLQIVGVSGGYGSGQVVRGISATLEAGKVLCVMGRNGVGKSTLLKLLMGYLKPVSGTVVYAGRDLTQASAYEHSQCGVCYCPQDRVVFDDLSVAENLSLVDRVRGLKDCEAYLDAFPWLRTRATHYAGVLSGGEKKILSFVRALTSKASLLIVDEPTEGVQYENIQRMGELLKLKTSTGLACLIVEQNLGLVDAVADDILVMDHGEIALAGAARAIDRSALHRLLSV